MVPGGDPRIHVPGRSLPVERQAHRRPPDHVDLRARPAEPQFLGQLVEQL